MHSRERLALSSAPFAPLLLKELRDILAGRAFWVLLLLMSPLVGYSFMQAVSLYGEASGPAGQYPEVARGLSPLDGIVVPTFGAVYLADTLLFPFVAIRTISEEKQNGGLKLLLQLPYDLPRIMAAKFVAILAVWGVALVPCLSAMAIWLLLGGHLGGAETGNLMLGHFLYVMVIVGIALFAAAIAEGSATAAIMTLAFTLGFWVLDFAAAGEGGFVQYIADLSLTAVLRGFEHGICALGTIAGALVGTFGLVTLSGTWLSLGVARERKLVLSLVIAAVTAFAILSAAQVAVYADATEDRRNSFAAADAEALGKIRGPLTITVNLSPQDPRFMDLERSVLGKLKRTMPNLTIDVASVRSTQFSTNDDSYGLIAYHYGDRAAMSRSTSPEEILPLIYQLASVEPPKSTMDSDYPGYPLVADARFASLWFYVVLPISILLVWSARAGMLGWVRNLRFRL